MNSQELDNKQITNFTNLDNEYDTPVEDDFNKSLDGYLILK